jgi:hypothetical protein
MIIGKSTLGELGLKVGSLSTGFTGLTFFHQLTRDLLKAML